MRELLVAFIYCLWVGGFVFLVWVRVDWIWPIVFILLFPTVRSWQDKTTKPPEKPTPEPKQSE